MIFPVMMSQDVDSLYDKARKKADDIHMTVNGNPLRGPVESNHDMLIEKNMDRLWRDAHDWEDPHTGEVYRAIRGMTLNKGE